MNRREEESRAEESTAAIEGLEGKNADELAEEIEKIRREMNTTLAAIERRLSAEEIFERALDYLQGRPKRIAADLGRSLRRTLSRQRLPFSAWPGSSSPLPGAGRKPPPVRRGGAFIGAGADAG